LGKKGRFDSLRQHKKGKTCAGLVMGSGGGGIHHGGTRKEGRSDHTSPTSMGGETSDFEDWEKKKAHRALMTKTEK